MEIALEDIFDAIDQDVDKAYSAGVSDARADFAEFIANLRELCNLNAAIEQISHELDEYEHGQE